MRSSLGRVLSLIAVNAIAFALSGCAPKVSGGLDPSARLVAEARSSGIALVDPMALDDDEKVIVEREARGGERPEDQLRYIAGWLGFRYEPSSSLPAREAFRTRRGDCMSYALLVTAIARHL